MGNTVDTGALKGSKGKPPAAKTGTPAAVKGKAAAPPNPPSGKTVGRGTNKDAAPTEKAAGIPKVSKYAGKKIKKLKNSEAREGSIRHKLIGAVVSSKTFEEATGKTVEHEGDTHSVNAGHVKFCLDNGYIELV